MEKGSNPEGHKYVENLLKASKHCFSCCNPILKLLRCSVHIFVFNTVLDHVSVAVSIRLPHDQSIACYASKSFIKRGGDGSLRDQDRDVCGVSGTSAVAHLSNITNQLEALSAM